jgi:hypothetical protein
VARGQVPLGEPAQERLPRVEEDYTCGDPCRLHSPCGLQAVVRNQSKPAETRRNKNTRKQAVSIKVIEQSQLQNII